MSQVSSTAIRRFLPDSAWMMSASCSCASITSVWNLLNTLSRLRSGHCDHSVCTARARSNAVAMSAGVDWGSSTSTSPV